MRCMAGGASSQTPMAATNCDTARSVGGGSSGAGGSSCPVSSASNNTASPINHQHYELLRSSSQAAREHFRKPTAEPKRSSRTWTVIALDGYVDVPMAGCAG